jgi:hypothetical protein
MAGRRTGNENSSALRAAFYLTDSCLFKVREHWYLASNLINNCEILIFEWRAKAKELINRSRGPGKFDNDQK